MGAYQILRWGAIASLSTAPLAVIAPGAMAQSAPPPGVTIPSTVPGRIEQTIPQPSESPRPLPSQPPPPSPQLQTPAIPQPPNVTSPISDRFFIKKVEVLGSTVLQKQIASIIKPFENREVIFDDLIGLRSAITQLYVAQGYVTSGAFLLNNQALSSGVVQIQVVEGELEGIEIGGLSRLRARYVRSRIAIAATKPLNRSRLEKALQLLQLDPLFKQVNAELTAGSAPGRNILERSAGFSCWG